VKTKTALPSIPVGTGTTFQSMPDLDKDWFMAQFDRAMNTRSLGYTTMTPGEIWAKMLRRYEAGEPYPGTYIDGNESVGDGQRYGESQ
jgi:hypothetical protein